MFIAVMGVNHRSAPVNVRERMSFSENKIRSAFSALLSQSGISGCCILSTCNRTEIYIASSEWEKGRKAVREFWAKSSGLDHSEISNYIFCYTLEEAVNHLFRVTSGLDSMVLGETEILGQVKRAYMLAHEAGATNSALNTLFQQALSTAKCTRKETGIDRNPVSIPYIAVELIKQQICLQKNNLIKNNSLAGCSVLVIGAGKMSELTLVHLKTNGISGIVVSNRSYDRAVELSQTYGGRAIRLDDIQEALVEADIVISGTAAQHIVLSADTVAGVMAQRPEKPLLLVDIALPRDIDPEVNKLAGVTLFDVDNLQHVVDKCWQKRQKAACLGERIIQKDCEAFMRKLAMSSVNPAIKSLQEYGEGIKAQELKRALAKLQNLTPRERIAVETLATSLTNKILLQPLLTLQEAALSSEGHFYSQIAKKLFGLEGSNHTEITETLKSLLQTQDAEVHYFEQYKAGEVNEGKLHSRKPEECFGSVANKVGYRDSKRNLSSV